MLNRKNSLVNLAIILSAFFFFTVLAAENNDFILPKKKIYLPTVDNEKFKKETINSNFFYFIYLFFEWFFFR